MRFAPGAMASPYLHGSGLTDAARAVACTTAVFFVAAGVIHVSAAADHTSLPVMMVGFLGVATGQAAFGALLLWRRPGSLLLIAGLVLTLGALASWLVSRTVGLPFLPGGHMEPIGFKDGVTVVFELASLPGLLLLFSRELDQIRLPSPRLGSTALAMVSAAAFALFIPALVLGGGEHHSAEQLAGMNGHSHGDGAEVASADAHDHTGGGEAAGGHGPDVLGTSASGGREHGRRLNSGDDHGVHEGAAQVPSAGGGGGGHGSGGHEQGGDHGGERDGGDGRQHTGGDHGSGRGDGDHGSGRGEAEHDGDHDGGAQGEVGHDDGGPGHDAGHGDGGPGHDAGHGDGGSGDGEGGMPGPDDPGGLWWGDHRLDYEPAREGGEGEPGTGFAFVYRGPPDPNQGTVGHHSDEPCNPTAEQRAAADRLYRETESAMRSYDNHPGRAVADGFTYAFPITDRITHMVAPSRVSDPTILDVGEIESFLYVMTDRGLTAVGGMYIMPKAGVPGPQIGGCITRWHEHAGAAGRLTTAGTMERTPEMLHVWTYPGLAPYGHYDGRTLSQLWRPWSVVPSICRESGDSSDACLP